MFCSGMWAIWQHIWVYNTSEKKFEVLQPKFWWRFRYPFSAIFAEVTPIISFFLREINDLLLPLPFKLCIHGFHICGFSQPWVSLFDWISHLFFFLFQPITCFFFVWPGTLWDINSQLILITLRPLGKVEMGKHKSRMQKIMPTH